MTARVRVDYDGRSGSAVVSSSGRSSARVVAMRGKNQYGTARREELRSIPGDDSKKPRRRRRSQGLFPQGGRAAWRDASLVALDGGPGYKDGAGGAAESGRRHPAEGRAVRKIDVQRRQGTRATALVSGSGAQRRDASPGAMPAASAGARMPGRRRAYVD